MATWLKSPADHRRAALALLGLAVLLGVALIAVPAWLLHRSYDSQLQRMARQQSSYNALNLKRPALMKSVDYLKGRDTRKMFLKGTTPALASAELQDIAKSTIEAASGRVLSLQALASREDNGYRQVSAMVQMSVNIQTLRRVLYALETREPYLFVDNLTVRAQVPSGFRPSAGFEPEMFVQIDLSAFSPPSETRAAGGDSKTGAKS